MKPLGAKELPGSPDLGVRQLIEAEDMLGTTQRAHWILTVASQQLAYAASIIILPDFKGVGIRMNTGFNPDEWSLTRYTYVADTWEESEVWSAGV